MDFLSILKEKAKKDKKTIVLPESYEARNLKAAAAAMAENLADIVLVGDKDEIIKTAEGLGVDVSKATFVNPKTYERKGEMIDLFCQLRKSKGVTPEQAEKTLSDPLYFGVMLVKLSVADGMVSGAIHPTADVIRPALQILKTAPGADIVSTFFLMVCKDDEYGADGVLMFSDCVLNQFPNAAELASIAATTAQSYQAFVGVEPKVAMLSHSTMGSAKHDEVTKVVEATKMVKEKYPELKIDGELQLDAAIVKEVGELKAPTSTVAGKANVLIFPNIDAGNIGYKLVQRFAKAEAYGPVMQGLAKPVNDLSRGCSAEDIVATIALTSIEAQMM